jgi:hypothetical protein
MTTEETNTVNETSSQEKREDVIVVGRHTNNVDMGVNIVDTHNITWSLDDNVLYWQWQALLQLARARKAAVLLQNVPGVLAAMLVLHKPSDVRIGIMASKPGERLANVTKDFSFHPANEDARKQAIKAVEFANSRAVILEDEDGLRITLDPISPYVFSHIKWIE